MTTTLCVRRSIYFFAYAGLFWWFVAVPSVAAADTALAGAYLQDHLNSPWVTMALVALGENPDTTYLQSAEGSTAIDLEAPILALTAAGKNPYTYPETDLIAALKAFYFEGQLGEKDMLNDDIFGILALVSAGVPGDDPVIAAVKEHIITHQNADGGWSYSVGGTNDTNTTAAAIMALMAAGLSPDAPSVVQGLAYVRAAQNADGGFPYDPQSEWGTASDASSDAWVLMALTAADTDMASFSASTSPSEHLLSLQVASSTGPTGYFEYQPGSGEDSFTPVTTSYAVIALSGKTLPVGTFVLPPPIPEAPASAGGSNSRSVRKKTKVDAALVLGTSTAPAVEGQTSTQDVLLHLPFSSDLWYGMQGAGVNQLQTLLIAEGFLAIAVPTGGFGPLTRTAVMQYQSAWGIVPTGLVGPVTRAWLNVRSMIIGAM